jgi:molybdopterin synthase catalytic subunit
MGGYLTDRPIDTAALVAETAAPHCGATVVFLGTVRNSPADGDVQGIEYSAYREMAEAELGRIVAETAARWPDARIALRHRLGWIAAGEASIAVAVACPHRDAAYAASRYVIEEVKRRVPIWKREQLATGDRRWVEPAERQAAGDAAPSAGAGAPGPTVRLE